jgi:LysM repeat protein
MGDQTRGGPPYDDPEATQVGAPPEGAIGDTTQDLTARRPEAVPGWSGDDAQQATWRQPVEAAPPSAQTPYTAPAQGPARHTPSGRGTAPAAVGVRPRRRRGRLNLARVIAPVLFLAAVIALFSAARSAGVIGGGDEPAKQPAAAATGKRTPKASVSASSTVTVKVRKVYRVKAGDTVSGIAAKFNTSAQELMDLNGLTSTTLRVGQKLKLPSPSP